jgi:hypothetical protein
MNYTLTISIWRALETLFSNLEHLGVDVNHFDSGCRVIVYVFAVIQEPHGNITYRTNQYY